MFLNTKCPLRIRYTLVPMHYMSETAYALYVVHTILYILGMRRYGHLTIRYVSIRRETIWLFSIRYDTDNNCKNPFIHEHNRGMLRLVSFTNTMARFTKELDKTNLFVMLKNNAQLKF